MLDTRLRIIEWLATLVAAPFRGNTRKVLEAKKKLAKPAEAGETLPARPPEQFRSGVMARYWDVD